MAPRTKGQETLEKIQELYYHKLGMPPLDAATDLSIRERVFEEWFQKEYGHRPPGEQAELRAKMRAEIDKTFQRELPTRYERPDTYDLLLSLAEQIEQSATDLTFALPVRPLIGTIPSGRVNARACFVKDTNEYLVMFESGLFTFALLMSKVVARAMPFTGEDGEGLTFSANNEDVDQALAQAPEVVRRFQEVLLAYLLLGLPGAAPPYILGHPYATLAALLRESMELFVMGHEFGHIIKGHLTSAPDAAADPEDAEGGMIQRNYVQEFEADSVGASLMLRAMARRQLDLSLSYWGADFFFSCAGLLERGAAILMTGVEPTAEQTTPLSDSHPPAEWRRVVLREALKRSLPDQSKGPIELGEFVERVLRKLWEGSRHVLFELHGQHRSPAELWVRGWRERAETPRG